MGKDEYLHSRTARWNLTTIKIAVSRGTSAKVRFYRMARLLQDMGIVILFWDIWYEI